MSYNSERKRASLRLEGLEDRQLLAGDFFMVIAAPAVISAPATTTTTTTTYTAPAEYAAPATNSTPDTYSEPAANTAPAAESAAVVSIPVEEPLEEPVPPDQAAILADGLYEGLGAEVPSADEGRGLDGETVTYSEVDLAEMDAAYTAVGSIVDGEFGPQGHQPTLDGANGDGGSDGGTTNEVHTEMPLAPNKTAAGRKAGYSSVLNVGKMSTYQCEHQCQSATPQYGHVGNDGAEGQDGADADGGTTDSETTDETTTDPSKKLGSFTNHGKTKSLPKFFSLFGGSSSEQSGSGEKTDGGTTDGKDGSSTSGGNNGSSTNGGSSSGNGSSSGSGNSAGGSSGNSGGGDSGSSSNDEEENSSEPTDGGTKPDEKPTETTPPDEGYADPDDPVMQKYRSFTDSYFWSKFKANQNGNVTPDPNADSNMQMDFEPDDPKSWADGVTQTLPEIPDELPRDNDSGDIDPVDHE